MAKYLVTYKTDAGKTIETVTEYGQIHLLDSLEDSLMTFTLKGVIVLAIPFRGFVSTHKLPPKPATIRQI